MSQRLARLLILLVFFLMSGATSAVAETRVRVGAATTISKFNDLTYQHVSLAFPLTLPAWAPSSLVAGVGVFTLNDDSTMVYAFGPEWRWDDAVGPGWFVDAGISLAYLEKPWFGNEASGEVEDFGMHIEFVSHLSLGMYIGQARRWSVEASFRHVSNGGLDETNPGADLVGLDMRFAY